MTDAVRHKGPRGSAAPGGPASGNRAAAYFAQPDGLTNYICHWSPRLRYVYVETPKVACTTIKRVLQAAELGPDRAAERPADVHERRRSPLLSPRADPDAFVAAMQDAAVFRFGFVRNPFSRALSCWLDKMVKNGFERARLAPKLGLDPDSPPAFADFLSAVAEQADVSRDIHWATQTYLLRPNRVRYSFIGRFEFFRPQFLAVCTRLGIEDYAGDLPDTWHATDASAKVREHVGAREADLIREIYRDDFGNFGYGWDMAVI
jgi:hypothetical protein